MHPRERAAASLLLPLALAVAGCAEGGREDRVQSEVRFDEDHHLYGFKGEQAFPGFPIRAADLQIETGVLGFADDSTWTLNGTAGSRYDLAKTGELVFRVPNGRSADLAFPGGYGLAGSSYLYFFVDRVKPKVGMFFGARTVRGAAMVEGEWHAFSLLALTEAGSGRDPDNVARAFGGSIAVDATGAITAGTARESTNQDLTITGNLNAFGDGSVEIGLSLDTQTRRLARQFTAAASVTQSQPPLTAAMLGLETADNDAAGALFLVRKRDGRAVLGDLAGEYLLGALTVFANPDDAGTEGSYGVLTLTDSGGWRIEARDSTASYRLSGSFEIDADGAMRLTVNASREQWLGAFDQDYNTVVIVDNDLTGTSSNRPELNLFLGLRKASPQ